MFGTKWLVSSSWEVCGLGDLVGWFVKCGVVETETEEHA